MFDILHKWLTNKLGINKCLNLNFGNVGEMFKNGVMFAHLLQKYQVIPDCYIRVLKKTNLYTACLSNIKNVNLWLKYLGIIIEDCTIYEIAHGQSIAVTKLLYQLYFKLEILKQYQILDNINIKEKKKLNNNIDDNLCKNNGFISILALNKKRNLNAKMVTFNYKTINVQNLFCCSEGIQHTAIDELKSTKSIKEKKNYILDLVQHNMNCYYNLLMKTLNNEFFTNEIAETSNEICKSTLFNIMNIKEEDNVIIDKIKNNNTTQISNKHIMKNINHLSNNLFYGSQENLSIENSIHSSMEMEELLLTQDLDEQGYKHLTKRDILYEYLQHSGLWSSEYLNVEPYDFNHIILSMIVKEVLNFEYSKSQIKCIEIKKTNVAGVIDEMKNTNVIELIKDNLDNKGILHFTADDALYACLNAYKEEMKISINSGILYQVLEEYEYEPNIENYINNQTLENNQANKSEVKQINKNNLINSTSNTIKSVSNFSTKSLNEINENPGFVIINKLTQTPENIPEIDYYNPVLSSMANMGKLINEKQMKNHDLQIGDVINCIGEFINTNQQENGWILLEYPVQPLYMALLEYKLTGKIPYYGKELCEYSKIKSNIVIEYPDNKNIYTHSNSYLSHCIKFIKHRQEIKIEKWHGFLQFYKEQNCIEILTSHLNSIKKHPKKAADMLVELILNKEKKFKTGNIFKLINIFGDDEDDDLSSESYDDNKVSDSSSVMIDDETSIQSNTIANQFQLVNNNLIWNEGNRPNYIYIVLYLREIWENMEQSYTHQIKELLNSKDTFFNDVKLTKNLIKSTVNQTIQFHNPSIISLINNYENESQTIITNNIKFVEHTIFELQVNMWDNVDSELEQIIQFIKHTISNQWIFSKNNALIRIYKQLLEIELKRTTTTLNFLNVYYDNINEYKINEFDFCVDIIDNDDQIDQFKKSCLELISKFKLYIYDNYEVIQRIDQWTQTALTEKNRFVNQVYRIKASMLLDITNLNGLTKIDQQLEKINLIYRFKINEINKLCKLLKCVANAGKNIKGLIKQISGKFYINELSVFEILCTQMFHTNFEMKQLKIIINKLLDNAPKFKMPINDLIDTLNTLSKTQNIYPKNWPTDDQFYCHFPKELLGSNINIVDWRDFVVQCMELPYPDIEQLLYYRKLFQAHDTGDETITIEKYETIKLWFENELNQSSEAKGLLYDMYQVKNRLNYTTMLLAFCRDNEPWIGLGKSYSLIFGWNPFDFKKIDIHPSIYQYEESNNYIKDSKNDIQTNELFTEEFIFDENIMTWFLITNLKLYINNGNFLEDISISQIVKSVFSQIKTKQIKATVNNLFQNNIMDDLYKTVFKFQTKKLPEIAKNIVIKYDLNINNILL